MAKIKHKQKKHIRTSKKGKRFIAGKGKDKQKNPILPKPQKVNDTLPLDNPDVNSFTDGKEYGNQYEKILRKDYRSLPS